MTPREAIERFNLQIAEKDGVKGFRVMAKKVSEKQIEMLKTMKPSIMAEFELIKKDNLEKREREIQEYIDAHSASFLRVLIVIQDEYMNLHMQISNVIPSEDRVGTPDFGANTIHLKHLTPHMKKVMERKGKMCGWGMAYEINAEDESIIIAEQTPAAHENSIRKIETATKAAEEKKIEEEKRAEKERLAFEEARETGKPVDLFSWAEDCNDPKEECSTDIVTVYAMPDGTKKTKRIHTW
jgi:hypothetical protein